MTVSPPGMLAPSRATMTFHILNGAWTGQPTGSNYVGELRGVQNDPVITTRANDGPQNLSLQLSAWPTALQIGYFVEARMPDGTVVGRWKHEDISATDEPGKADRTLNLFTLRAELNEPDFRQNYTATADAYAVTPLGPQKWSRWVSDAVPLCKHLSLGTVRDDTVAYSYDFALSQAHPVDALNQAINFGGDHLYWVVTATGYVHVLRTSDWASDSAAGLIAAWRWRRGREIRAITTARKTTGTYNRVIVYGGTPPGSSTAIVSIAENTDPLNPLSTVNLGPRTTYYTDASLLTQASADAISAKLLAASLRVSTQRRLRVQLNTGIPKPGDVLFATIGQDDPGTSPVTLGPMLIIEVTMYGATGWFDVVANDDLYVSPFQTPGNLPSSSTSIGPIVNLPPLLPGPTAGAGKPQWIGTYRASQLAYASGGTGTTLDNSHLGSFLSPGPSFPGYASISEAALTGWTDVPATNYGLDFGPAPPAATLFPDGSQCVMPTAGIYVRTLFVIFKAVQIGVGPNGIYASVTPGQPGSAGLDFLPPKNYGVLPQSNNTDGLGAAPVTLSSCAEEFWPSAATAFHYRVAITDMGAGIPISGSGVQVNAFLTLAYLG